MDGKWGNLGICYFHLKPSKSMDQIQQNFVKPTNHKKIWGIFLVGIFEIGEEHNKIRLGNKEGRL